MLRLATFNLKDFFLARTPAEEATVAAKIANVVREVERADADVLALQEVGAPELLARFAHLGYGPPVVGTPDHRGIRNAILSRLPILWSQVHEARSLPFPRFREDDAEALRIPFRRAAVHVRVEAGALGEVDVLTAHFKSNLPAPMKRADGTKIPDATAHARAESAVRSLVQRMAEALYVRRLVDEVFERSPDHALCVLGDLNDVVDSVPVTLLRGVGEEEAHELHPAATMVAEERRFSVFHANKPSLIDHLLLSQRLRLAQRSCTIFNEALRYHGPHVDDGPLTEDSDHALCVAAFDS